MLKTFFIGLCLLISIAAQAQYDDLLRNPHIVWIAEYTTDFFMNPEDEAEKEWMPQLNYLSTIQLQNTSATNGLMGTGLYNPQFLSGQIFKHLHRRDFQSYSDSTLQTLLSPEALETRLVKIDTGISSESSEPLIIRIERSSDDITAFRLRQVFWYDIKQHQFGSRFLAYAPVINVKDNEGNWLHRRQPLFWLPGEMKLPKRWKNRHFAYIFQTRMVENAPRMEDFKVIKGHLDVQKLVSEEVAHPTQHWVNIEKYQPIHAAEMAAICFGVDTIYQFIYENNQEKTFIQPWNRIREIDKINFVQNWYYDERQHQFYGRFVGWGPLAAIRDEDGKLRYHRVLFYQIND